MFPLLRSIRGFFTAAESGSDQPTPVGAWLCRHSHAGVVDGVVRTVTGAVAAEEAGQVLGGDGGVVSGSLGPVASPRVHQDVVGVLTRRCGGGGGLHRQF